MDFRLSKEQKMLKKSVREFAEKKVSPIALELDRQGDFPWQLVREVCRLGLLGLVFPPELGGTSLGHVARIVSMEEISKASASLGLFLQASPLGLWAIYHFGKEEQKEKFVPPVVRGDRIMWMAVTEPCGGSNPLAIVTEAKLDGDEYVINGRKCFITNGSVGDVGVLIAKTSAGAGGISAFIVEKGTPGFEPGRVERHAGMRAMDVSELVFTECRIPKENLLGRKGEGLKAALTSISEIGRMGNAAVCLGIAEAAYEASLKFSKQREMYGRPIAQLQGIQFMLADMDVEIEAARLLVYKAAWLLDQGERGKEINREISSAKLYASEVARRIATKAVQIHGGYGTLEEYHVMRYLRDALEQLSSAGTNEILRVIIGREITS